MEKLSLREAEAGADDDEELEIAGRRFDLRWRERHHLWREIEGATIRTLVKDVGLVKGPVLCQPGPLVRGPKWTALIFTHHQMLTI